MTVSLAGKVVHRQALLQRVGGIHTCVLSTALTIP
jgi:hypothetical protein